MTQNSQKHILIIDDDPKSVELLRDRLEAAGYSVSFAEDGKRGWELIGQLLPDLVILDLLLPGLNGFQLCKMIKRNKQTATIPLITLTAVFVEDFDKKKAIQIGADTYMLKADVCLPKPCNINRLLNAIRILLGEEKEIHLPPGPLLFVIDDDPDTIELVRAGLEPRGYKVVGFTDPKEGFKKIFDAKPDLVLLDIRFPNANGLDILSQIREKDMGLLVIMLSAHVSQEAALEALRLGANDYILKPVNSRDLWVRVKEVVEKQRLKKERDALISTLKQSNIHLMHRYEKAEKLLQDLKKVQQDLVRMEKLHALGVLAAGAAHELNNPLAIILGNAQDMEMMLHENMMSPEHHKYLREGLIQIQTNVGRCVKIIRGLSEFARLHPMQGKSCDVASILEEALTLARKVQVFEQIKISSEVQKDLPAVQADPDQIQQVFMNLLMNAHQAMPFGGTLTIQATRAQAMGKRSRPVVQISFSDTGEGISRGNLRRIFDPFFTTRQPGEGVGLGLFVSYEIVARHGGNLDAFSKGKGHGAEFVVTLPVKRIKDSLAPRQM